MADSLEGITDIMRDACAISKRAGGIGISISDIRAYDSPIKGTNGKSSGVCPFVTIFNYIARAVNQGGVRKGAIACFMEIWHADVETFIRMRTEAFAVENTDLSAKDLFYGLMIPNVFMEILKKEGDIYLQ